MVDGEPVTISDLPDQVQTRLKAMEFQYLSERHQLLDAAVQSVLTRRLLQEQADAEGIALSELVASKTDGNISVSDDAIEPVCRQLAEANAFRRGAVVLHCSGALGSERYFKIDVPAGTNYIQFAISGGTGNADMYLRQALSP